MSATATATPPREIQIEYKRPWMYEKQLDALFNGARYAVVEASTKSGKTVGCLAWLAEQAFQGREGWIYWWVAPIYAQAKIAFRRMKRSLPKELYHANEGELTITLWNGAVIWFKGADDPNALFGEDVSAAVIDEATRVKQDAWSAVRTTVTHTEGPIRIIGNVKGRKNWAYKAARRAQTGEQNWHYARITCWDAVEAGVLDIEEIEDARRTLPENVFRELYEAEAADDINNPFGLEFIRARIAPMSSQRPRVFGWDLAKKQDYTVGVGLDANGHVSEFRRFQLPWEETIDRITGATGRVPALVDATGVGDPILENLQRRGQGRYEGFTFSQRSKQQLMEGLAVAIQQGRVHYPDGPIVQELEAFEYEYTGRNDGVRYRAPSGMNDDCVMALALAVRQTTKRPTSTGNLKRIPRAA